MIDIYKLGEDFKFTKYDTWDNGKFSGPLSGLDIKEDEIEKRFNTSYYRTDSGKGEKTEDKTDDKTKKKTDEKTQKIEIRLGEL